MSKWIYLLIVVVVFDCKKNTEEPRINIRQQPSKIEIFSVDTSSGVTTLQSSIHYFYNDTTNRFDSVQVAGKIYRFDYAALTSNHKVLINYTTPDVAHDEIIFNTDFYALTNYNQILAVGDTNTNVLQFDAYKRITNFSFKEKNTVGNFSQNFLYKNDSIFITTNKPFDNCIQKDTIMNTAKDMSTHLPYLLFVNPQNNCGADSFNLMKAMSISNYMNKLPYKIWNEIYESSYIYKGDSKQRLSEVTIITRLRVDNTTYKKTKIVVTY